MEYRKLGNTGYDISAVSYGGIVSRNDGQEASDRYVAFALEQGVNYFDVAPGYGDAQEKLGNSLKGRRNDIVLACKTEQRMLAEAERDLEQSMKLLHTDYFDIYQLHGLASLEDVERAFGPGGVMELLVQMKRDGRARKLGITAHSEDAALRAMELYDFDTLLFPINWFMNIAHGYGSRVIKAAKERGMGLLAMKAFIERKWVNDDERVASVFPKSWCKPIDIADAQLGIAAMKYALSLGADTLIPPGNIASFGFALEHIDECLDNPLSAQDRSYLEERIQGVAGMEFFEW